MPVIAAAGPGAWLIAWLNAWAAPIMLDPNWNGGDYYAGAAPLAGLAEGHQGHCLACRPINSPRSTPLLARDSPSAIAIQEPRLGTNSPSRPLSTRPARQAAATSDANHLLYLVKANQSFIPGMGAGAKTAAEGLKRIKAPALCLFAPTDARLFPRSGSGGTVAALADNGLRVESAEIEEPLRPSERPLRHRAVRARRIAEFLARPA